MMKDLGKGQDGAGKEGQGCWTRRQNNLTSTSTSLSSSSKPSTRSSTSFSSPRKPSTRSSTRSSSPRKPLPRTSTQRLVRGSRLISGHPRPVSSISVEGFLEELKLEGEGGGGVGEE